MKRNIKTAGILFVILCFIVGVIWLLANPLRPWPAVESLSAGNGQARLASTAAVVQYTA